MWIKSHLQFLLLVVATTIFLLGVVPPTSAAESCGIGGGGNPGSGDPSHPHRASGDESGIGGTGVREESPQERPVSGDESESGIGGTGIFGTVTSIDRLCVNGLEIAVPEQLSVQSSMNGNGDRALAIGMVVWIRAQMSDQGLVAEYIQIHSDLAGQIETITRDGKELTVSGQRVRLANDLQRGPQLESSEPRAGQWVSLYGLRDDAGVFVATRIEHANGGEIRQTSDRPIGWTRESALVRRVSIEGYITGHLARPRLAGLELEFAPAPHPINRAGLVPGARVTAVGRITQDSAFRLDRMPAIENPTRLDSPHHPAPTTQKPSRRPDSGNALPKHEPRDLERPDVRPAQPPVLDRPPKRPIDRPIDRRIDRPIIDRVESRDMSRREAIDRR